MKNIFDKKTLKQNLKAVTTAAVLIPVKIFADGPFETVTKATNDTNAKFFALGLVIAGFMMVLCGIGFTLSKKLREMAKEHMGYVLAGVIVMVISGQLIAWVSTTFGGN